MISSKKKRRQYRYAYSRTIEEWGFPWRNILSCVLRMRMQIYQQWREHEHHRKMFPKNNSYLRLPGGSYSSPTFDSSEYRTACGIIFCAGILKYRPSRGWQRTRKQFQKLSYILDRGRHAYQNWWSRGDLRSRGSTDIRQPRGMAQITTTKHQPNSIYTGTSQKNSWPHLPVLVYDKKEPGWPRVNKY